MLFRSGLRSGDLSMPEEVNRIEIDQRSSFLFVSEQSGLHHLQSEGVKGSIHFVGNTMIDTLIRMMPIIQSTVLPLILPESYGVATLHRPSNVDSPKELGLAIDFLSQVSTRIPILLPLHRRTQSAIDAYGLRKKIPTTVRVIDPLGYVEFLALVSRASVVITDSGGLQEESTFLQKKCFTLRHNTERPSTIESGSNEQIGRAHV